MSANLTVCLLCPCLQKNVNTFSLHYIITMFKVMMRVMRLVGRVYTCN